MMSVVSLITGYGPECRQGNGAGYLGKQSTTVTGKTCRQWAGRWTVLWGGFSHAFLEPTVVMAKNYCRVFFPDYGPDSLWCYIEGGGTDENELCNVPECGVI